MRKRPGQLFEYRRPFVLFLDRLEGIIHKVSDLVEQDARASFAAQECDDFVQLFALFVVLTGILVHDLASTGMCEMGRAKDGGDERPLATGGWSLGKNRAKRESLRCNAS